MWEINMIKAKLYKYVRRKSLLSRYLMIFGGKIYFRGRANILILPVFECNYSCPYCIVRKSNFVRKFRKHSAIEWANELNKLRPSLIHISGGEPLLWENDGMKTFLENIERKHAIFIVTNLSFEVQKHLPYLKKANERLKLFISTSFHPYMTDVSEFIMKLKILLDNGLLVSSSIVAYPPLFQKLEYFKKKFDDARIPFGINSYIHPDFRYSDEHKRFLEKITKPENIRDFDKYPKKKVCYADNKYFMVVPNGDCYICFSGFYCVNSKLYSEYKAKKGDFCIGNLFDGTFRPKQEKTICNLPCSEECDIEFAKPKILDEFIDKR